MRLLLDENVPEGVRRLLPDHDVQTVQEMGLAGLSNGKLLDAAERAGFSALLTGDKNIPHQQRLAGRKIAIIAFSTQHWPTLRANPQPIRDAIEQASEGGYVSVVFPRLPLRRRPPPSSRSS